MVQVVQDDGGWNVPKVEDMRMTKLSCYKLQMTFLACTVDELIEDSNLC